MMKALIAKPINNTQIEFNALCEKGGGQKGGPTRKKTLELLRASGRALNIEAHNQITEALDLLPGANPWHVCYAVAMNWGRLARADPTFTEAAVGCLESFNAADVATACKFPFEKGPDAVRDSLHGGWIAFSKLALAGPLPTDLPGMVRAQAKWLRVILTEKPRFVGAWNGTALFMVALFANPKLAATMTEPEVLLPIGGPISAGLNILHQAHLLSRPSEPKEESESLDFGQITLINGQFAEVQRGLDDWSLVDVHSGLYMLGTRLPESKAWYP
jgi:hypothetical protein